MIQEAFFIVKPTLEVSNSFEDSFFQQHSNPSILLLKPLGVYVERF